MSTLEPSAESCLVRTRTAVVNVLVATGFGIALSGLVLRWRDRGAVWRASEGMRRAMLAVLIGLAIASYAARRIGAAPGSDDPIRRAERFYRAHALAAAIGALAVPLGLVYGWTVRPRLDAVSPFWVAALALGSLAWPRASELEGFEIPAPEPLEPTS